VFVDSAPVLERALARNAGLGWIGKHTCLIDRDGGSWFFLGEVYVDLPLPIDAPASAHCGTCVRCIEICPTQAIVAPHRSMRGAAFPISRSSTKARSIRNCGR
jgi:epoxyqueuosine reductase